MSERRPSRLALLVPALLAAPLAAQATTTATPLAAAAGWRAERIHTSDGGVWYAHVDKVVDHYGANEIIAGDDKGRLLLLAVYSAQWTAHSVVCDGQWLAPTRSADVDPRVPGREIYAGGRGGSIHRVTLRPEPFARFHLESVEIGHAGGEEFHAVLAADLVPGGNAELVAFAIRGGVFQLTPDGDGDGFRMRRVGTVPGRVRDVVVVPGAGAAGPAMYGVSRSGDLVRMQLTADGLPHRVVLHEDCGLGRIALAKGRPDVLYVTRDDGVVVRVQLGADGAPQREPIFAGGQGLRGVASGRFFADDREAIAAYGYDRTVHLITRKGEGWQVETLLTTVQRGHWLAVGELDGRNTTDELVATGFDGDVVLLARAPGHGLPGVAVPAAERHDAGTPATPAAKDRPLRVAARFGPRAGRELSPLNYGGGFETKTLVYETLVRVGAGGRIAPGLAAAWRTEDGGRTFVFTLRDGATWHDGSPVRAADVATYFRRWAGLPQHAWLRSGARVVAARATGDRELRVELERPAALLADLCAINPCAVAAPATWDREGEFARPVGSGPFVFDGSADAGTRLRYRANGGAAAIELVQVDGDPLDALLRRDVDAVVGGALVDVDAGRAVALRRDPRFTVADAPGSAMWHLELRFDRGPLADVARRAAVAAAVDRAELVRVAAAGLGDASTGWAAPCLGVWPQGKPPAAPAGVTWPGPLRLFAGDADTLLVATLVGQLQRAGIPIARAGSGCDEHDLRLVRTHGAPYDPFTIVERYGRRAGAANAANAATDAGNAVDAELAGAIDAWIDAADEASWPEHFARIQARLDALVPVVPLFAPRRIAVVAKGAPVPALDADHHRLDLAWLAAPR